VLLTPWIFLPATEPSAKALGIFSNKFTASTPNEPNIAPAALPKAPFTEPDPTLGRDEVYWF
jgi:hypothetical protein